MARQRPLRNKTRRTGPSVTVVPGCARLVPRSRQWAAAKASNRLPKKSVAGTCSITPSNHPQPLHGNLPEGTAPSSPKEICPKCSGNVSFEVQDLGGQHWKTYISSARRPVSSVFSIASSSCDSAWSFPDCHLKKLGEYGMGAVCEGVIVMYSVQFLPCRYKLHANLEICRTHLLSHPVTLTNLEL